VIKATTIKTKKVKIYFYAGLFLLFCQLFKAQINLVPNGSFETYTQCPNISSQIYFAPPWTGPTTNSSDYLNGCSQTKNVPYYGGVGNNYFYLNAWTGQAYAGIQVWNAYNWQSYREYLQVKLLDSLKIGNCYYVEFYAANVQYMKYRVNNIAASLTSFSLQTNLAPPGIIPNIQSHITNYNNPVLQDTVKWHKIAGIYEALGGEKYITIGNFKDNSHTDTINIYPKGSFPYSMLSAASYVFIDAVSIYSINPNGAVPWSYRDTTINKGDSVYIGNKMGGLNFHPQWFMQNGTYIKTNAGITVSPTITTKYYVQYTLCGVQRTDTLKVTVPEKVEVGLKKLKMKNQELNLSFQANILIIQNNSAKNYNVKVFNLFGATVFQKKNNYDSMQLNFNDYNNGIYFIQIENEEGVFQKKILKSP